LGFTEAIPSFEKTIKLQPDFAPAYVGLAACYGGMAFKTGVEDPIFIEKEQQALLRALELDPNLAEAHAVLGHFKLRQQWDWQGAESELRRAIQLDPNSYPAHLYYSYLLTDLGRMDEALSESNTALRLSPFVPYVQIVSGRQYFTAGEYGKAIQIAHDVENRDSKNWATHLLIGDALAMQGNLARGRAELETAVQMNSHRDAVGDLGFVYAAMGQREQAKKLDQRLSKDPEGAPNYYQRAIIATGLGNKREAIHLLDEAYKVHSGDMAYVAVDPLLRNLHSEPRFQELLRQMRLPQL
jgi:tetratricopeptide (TPR) repeat protein